MHVDLPLSTRDVVNLQAMVAMGERFDCPVGLSDHTPDV